MHSNQNNSRQIFGYFQPLPEGIDGGHFQLIRLYVEKWSFGLQLFPSTVHVVCGVPLAPYVEYIMEPMSP